MRAQAANQSVSGQEWWTMTLAFLLPGTPLEGLEMMSECKGDEMYRTSLIRCLSTLDDAAFEPSVACLRGVAVDMECRYLLRTAEKLVDEFTLTGDAIPADTRWDDVVAIARRAKRIFTSDLKLDIIENLYLAYRLLIVTQRLGRCDANLVPALEPVVTNVFRKLYASIRGMPVSKPTNDMLHLLWKMLGDTRSNPRAPQVVHIIDVNIQEQLIRPLRNGKVADYEAVADVLIKALSPTGQITATTQALLYTQCSRMLEVKALYNIDLEGQVNQLDDELNDLHSFSRWWLEYNRASAVLLAPNDHWDPDWLIEWEDNVQK